MGCCFSTEAEEKRPLLGGPQTHTESVARQTVPSGAAGEVYKLAEKPAFLKKGIEPVRMREVGVAEVDKRLQDHANLYNLQVRRWYDLHAAMDSLNGMFPERKSKEGLVGLFAHVKSILDQESKVTTLEVKQKFKHCYEIQFEEREVPWAVVEALRTFNRANRLVREILDKGPLLVTSMQLVIKDEKSLRRDVVVASLGSSGPDRVRACNENVSDLRKAVNKVEDIRRDTISQFGELRRVVTFLGEGQ